MKHSGDYAELKFMVLMHELGYSISKPICNSYRYDFIVDYGTHLSRVQVKSTRVRYSDKYYRVNVSSNNGSNTRIKYDATQIDEFYLYLIDVDAWYRIPVNEVDALCVRIYHDNPEIKSKYHKFKLNERGRINKAENH